MNNKSLPTPDIYTALTFTRLVSKKILLSFIAFFFLLNVNAQSIDSLWLKARSLPLADTTRINILNKISHEYAYADNLDSSMVVANQALHIANSIEYHRGVATALSIIGMVYYYKNDYPRAQEYLLKCIDYSILHRVATLGDALNTIAGNYLAQGNYVQALDNFLAALKIREQNNFTRGIGGIYMNLVILYTELGDHQSAIAYSQKAIAFCKATNRDKFTMSKIYNNLGFAYLNKGDYKNALINFQQAYHDLHGDPRGKLIAARAVGNIGICYTELDSLEKADEYLSRCLQLEHERGDEEDYASTQNDVCLLRLKQNRLQESVRAGEYALHYFLTTNNHFDLIASYTTLSKVYSALGNTRKAFDYVTAAYALNDSLKTAKLIVNLSDIQKGYEMAKRESQIELLSQQAKTKEIELQQRRNMMYVLIGGVLLLLFAVGATYAALRIKAGLNKKLNEKYQEIREQKEAIESINYDLRAQALCSQMNPHFIFNCMTTVDGFILKNERQQSSELLTSFARLARQVLENSDRKMIPLEQELASLELYLTIEKLRMGDNFNYSIQSAGDAEFDLPPLLLQPYVENAIVHGVGHDSIEKKKIDISIKSPNEHELVIAITDNGVGRGARLERQSVAHRSMGMKITAERLALLKHSNGIDAQSDIIDLVNDRGEPCGTRVIITLRKEVEVETDARKTML